jgi:hypothetical protein
MPRSRFDPPFSGPEALRLALRPGHTFERWEISGLIHDLERQCRHIETVVAGENARVAAAWLQEMVAACRRKFDEVEDRDGEFVCWWSDELVVAWIRARQRARAPSTETVALLLQDSLSEEGGIEAAWVEALNRAGLRALEGELLRRAGITGRGRAYERDLQSVDLVRERLRRMRRPDPEGA